MGTNYRTPPSCPAPCAHCTDEGLHIGKRSAGWTFGFEAHPERGLVSWATWKEFLKTLSHVEDEYGRHLSFEEFVQIVEDSRKPWGQNKIEPMTREQWLFDHGVHDDRAYVDPEGWDFHEGRFS